MAEISDLEKWMQEKGYDQVRLSQLLGISQQLVSAIIRGTRRVSKEVGLKLRELGFNGSMPTPNSPTAKYMEPEKLVREAFSVISEFRKLGLKERSPEKEQALLEHMAKEVQKAYGAGEYTSAKALALELWSLRTVLK